MKNLSATTIKVIYPQVSPVHIKPDTKLIISVLGRYHRGLETKDFVFFINYQEGDENACVKMYRKNGWELASDNYFAYGAFFEVLDEQNEDITYISKSMKNNLRLHKEANPQ